MFSFTLMDLHNFNICSLICLSFSNISNESQWTGPQPVNKETYLYSQRYKQEFQILSVTAIACFIPLTVSKTVTMLCQTTKENFTFLGLVAGILNRGHTHYNRSNMNPIQHTAYNLYTVIPQPEDLKIL